MIGSKISNAISSAEVVVQRSVAGNAKPELIETFLDSILDVTFYEGVAEYVEANDHLLEDENGDKLEQMEVFEDADSLEAFFDRNNVNEYYRAGHNDLLYNILVAEPLPGESSEAETYILVLDETTEYTDILNFINEALSYEQVTAPTGIENRITVKELEL